MADVILNDLGLPISQEEFAEIQAAVADIPQTTYYSYIVAGDEPGKDVINLDLSAYVDAATFSSLKESLKVMPRLRLKEWYEAQVAPLIPREFNTVVWKAFINLFNRVNIDHLNSLQAKGLTIDPWTWEGEKLRASYTAEMNAGINSVMANYDQAFTMALQNQQDPIRVALEERFAKLTPILDSGLEINRQNAIKKLLDDKEYDTVSDIITLYENAPASVNDAFKTVPVFDMELAGSTITQSGMN